MSQRKNTAWKIRITHAGDWLFENGYPALFWSGLIVNLSILLFEEQMEEHSCVSEKNHYFKDAGKMLFWAIFVTRLSLYPLLLKFLRNTMKRFPSEETVSRIEVEGNDGIET